MSPPIVLYDGVCGLCNRLVQFLLKRDRHDRLRFASLQSDFAKTLLHRHGVDARDLDTVYVIVSQGEPDESVLVRSEAILHLLSQLGGIWTIARLAGIVPRQLWDLIYKLVARNRYRVFGKYETCLLPDAKYRQKFLDIKAARPPDAST